MLAPTARDAATSRTLLEAVLNPPAVDSLVERAAASLEHRLGALLASERARRLEVIDGLDLPPDGVDQLRAGARRLDDRRFEQAMGQADTATP